MAVLGSLALLTVIMVAPQGMFRDAICGTIEADIETVMVTRKQDGGDTIAIITLKGYGRSFVDDGPRVERMKPGTRVRVNVFGENDPPHPKPLYRHAVIVEK